MQSLQELEAKAKAMGVRERIPNYHFLAMWVYQLTEVGGEDGWEGIIQYRVQSSELGPPIPSPSPASECLLPIGPKSILASVYGFVIFKFRMYSTFYSSYFPADFCRLHTCVWTEPRYTGIAKSHPSYRGSSSSN
jgi:hypothetical protein